MAAVFRQAYVEWDPSVDGDRRRREPRRHADVAALDDPYRIDDRRFGLGRRWEDWCHPRQEAPGQATSIPRR